MTPLRLPAAQAAFIDPSRISLRTARGACVVTIGAALALFAIGAPAMAREMQHVCRGPTCYRWQVTPALASQLAKHGLSLQFNAAYTIADNAIFILGFCLIAATLILRRPDEPMALFGAFTLVTFGASFVDPIGAVATLHSPIGWWTYPILAGLGWSSLFIFFYLFPTGRFVPRWTRATAIAWFVYIAVMRLSPLQWGINTSKSDLLRAASPPPNQFAEVYGNLVIFFFLSVIVAQVYRYLRVSGPVERQQTKWVVCGFIAAFGGLAVLVSIPGSSSGSVINSVAGNLIGRFVFDAVLLLLPLSFAIAILRYRLYDIDVVINRTLVYLSLTVSLAGMYILGVIAIQAVFRAITGQASDLAVAIVTLAIAALFNPWRTRIQRFIDRRFYRRKYDAARTLAQLQTTLRDEVDLELLRAAVLTVAVDTLQPSSIAIWIGNEKS